MQLEQKGTKETKEQELNSVAKLSMHRLVPHPLNPERSFSSSLPSFRSFASVENRR
jgi:hypothetical protein